MLTIINALFINVSFGLMDKPTTTTLAVHARVKVNEWRKEKRKRRLL